MKRLTGVVSLAAAFTVLAGAAPAFAAAPAVTGFSPAGGDAGATFTIAGSGFSTNVADDKVTVNGVAATVTAATGSSLTALIPAGAGPGKVSVTTPEGNATSAEDFVIAPERYKYADIAYTGALTPDAGDHIVDIGAAKKIGLLRFTGVAGQRISFGFDKSTLNSRFDVKPYLPNGKQMLVDGFSVSKNFAKEGGQFLLPPLPVTGTYSLAIDPTTDTGVGKVNVTQPSIVDAGPISATGDPVQLDFTKPWQYTSLTFNAEAGKVYSLQSTDWAFPASSQVLVTVAGPDGKTLPPAVFNNRPAALPFEAKLSGAYQVLAVSDSLSIGSPSGSFKFTLSESVEAGTVEVNGAPKQLTVTRAGQAQKLTFQGKTGQKLGFGLTDFDPNGPIPSLSIIAPNGKRWDPPAVGPDAEIIDPLPVDGTYTLWVNPVPGTGNYKLWVSEDVNAGALPFDGAAAEISVDRPGQNVRFTIQAAAGQKAGLGMQHPWGTGMTAILRAPDGKILLNQGVRNTVDLTFPVAGTYEFIADLGNVSGFGTFTLSKDVDAGVLADSLALNVTRVGQNVRSTFDGTAGQRISLGFSDVTLAGQYRVRLFQPNGTEIGGGFGSVYVGRDDKDIVLPVTGKYEIQLDPTDENTETGTVRVTLSTAVNGGTITVGGPGVALATPRIGQDGVVGFAGTAGQKLALTFANNVFTPSKIFRVTVLGPDGKPLAGFDQKLKQDEKPLALPALPAGGNYTVVIDGDRASTGGITVGLVTG